MAELQPPNFDLHPMRALFLMSQRSFKSPKLKDQSRNKWSKEFHDIIKVSLTKSSGARVSLRAKGGGRGRGGRAGEGEGKEGEGGARAPRARSVP